MANKIFVPKGPDAIDAGSFIDDAGQRFMTVIFTDEVGDTVTVTMLIPLFQAFSKYIADIAEMSGTRDYWRDHPRD